MSTDILKGAGEFRTPYPKTMLPASRYQESIDIREISSSQSTDHLNWVSARRRFHNSKS